MSLDIYPKIIHDESHNESSYCCDSDIDRTCQEMHDACKGFGTDESKLIEALGKLTVEQRCIIPQRYKEMFEIELHELIQKECGNKNIFSQTLQFLAVNPVVAECVMINAGCKGFGTDEMVLLTILLGRSNNEINILKKKFFQINTEDLGKYLDNELGGTIEYVMYNALQGCEEDYDPVNYHTDDKMKDDIETIYQMGQGQWGTNEKGLFQIICSMPPEYIKQLNLQYATKYGYTLEKILEQELNGISKKAAVYLIGMKIKPYETIAKCIKDACVGIGTNELLLSTLLIRYQDIMKLIAVEHIELYGITIIDRIKNETTHNSNYQKLLLQILESSNAF